MRFKIGRIEVQLSAHGSVDDRLHTFELFVVADVFDNGHIFLGQALGIGSILAIAHTVLAVRAHPAVVELLLRMEMSSIHVGMP